MKRLIVILALVSASQAEALTVKSDFLRAAQIVKDAKFPLQLNGYLHLSFRLNVDQIDKEGVKASVDKLIAGKVVDTYKGFLAYGKRESIEFSDGSIGPKILLETDQQTVQEPSQVELPDQEKEID